MATLPQVPLLPDPFFAAEQAWHSELHAVLQHTPSTHWLLRHDAFDEQALPLARHPSSVLPLQLLSRPSQTSVDGDVFCWHTTAPPEQEVVPWLHTPSRPVEHANPPPGLPLSVIPLQSSSRPLQVSDIGIEFCVQTIDPLVQLVVPIAQMPSMPVLHGAPPPGLPLSTMPLQSSSAPLHVSDVAETFGVQTIEPLVHVVVPLAQMPGCPVEHMNPPPGFPSSVLPSQLLSALSQVSGAGVGPLQTSAPAVQVVTPAQDPDPLVMKQTPPTLGSLSSIAALQLSSKPLQISMAPGLTEALLSLQSPAQSV
jgi:hypothetical protein